MFSARISTVIYVIYVKRFPSSRAGRFIIRWFEYTEWSKKQYPGFNFAITSVNVHRFQPFFTVTSRYLWRKNVRLRLPPHLYFVTALPSKTHSIANIDVTCLIYW